MGPCHEIEIDRGIVSRKSRDLCPDIQNGTFKRLCHENDIVLVAFRGLFHEIEIGAFRGLCYHIENGACKGLCHKIEIEAFKERCHGT